MPPVLVAAALAYAGAITLGTALVVTASYALGQYQASRARKAAREAFNAAQKDRFITVSLVDAPRSRIYGRARNADGVLFKGTYGDKKQYLQLVVAGAAHEVDGIETVFFGDVAVGLDANGYVTTKPWNKDARDPYTATVLLDASGNGTYTPSTSGIWDAIVRALVPDSVSAYVYLVKANGDGTYGAPVPTSTVGGTVYLTGGAGLANQVATLVFQGDASASKARVRKFTGAPGQDLSPYLVGNFPSLIQSGKHRFEGIACLLVDLEYDQDVYPQGVPQITMVMRGAKITDRRTGITAWTQNPSVIADDWARYAAGGGADDDEIDAPMFIAAANACDVSHTFSSRNQDGVVTNTTRPMYTCNIALDTTADAQQNFEAIVESMAGRWAWSGGQLRVRAGVYTAPVAVITESWLSGEGDIEIVGTLPRAERVNVITPTIYNAAASYTLSPQARVAADAYIELDGEELPQEVTLEGVTDGDHAAHIVGVMMRESRQALTVKLPCKFIAYPLQVLDVVALNLPRFGWSGKPFEVQATEMTQAGGVPLVLKETDASVFDPDAEFTRQDPAPNTALPNPFTVPTLTIASTDSGTAQLLKQADGSIVTRMRVTWAAIADEAVRNGGSVEVQARRVGSTEVVTETVAGTETQAFLTGLKDGNAYAVTIRARNKLVAGLPSFMVTHVVAGKSQAPSNVAGLTAAVIPGAVHISWTACPDIDYDYTRLRYGASWAAGVELPFNRPGTSYDWPWPAAGAYTIWAAHVDTSGNPSAAPQSYAVTVDSSILIGASGINAPPEWLNANLVPSINAAKGSNLFAGSLTAATSTYLGGAITATGVTDPRGSTNAVTISIPAAGSYVHYRAFTGLQVGYYTAKVRVFVGGGDQIVVSGTDAATWAGGAYAIATRAGAPGWVQVSLRLYTSTGNMDVVFGSFLDTPSVFSSPLPIAVNISDLWVEREDAGTQQAIDAAATAQGAANTAATNASSALSTLATMRSNGYLDAAEKPAVMKAWQAIADESAGIYGQGSTYGLIALRNAYSAARDALEAYLNGLSPAWNNTSVDTPITPATDQATWAAYYSARQTLLNAVADETAKRADWAQVSGSGKPQDNATQNDVVYSGSAPSSPTYRMTWIDTSVTPRTLKVWSGSAWLLAGTYVNGTAQIADDANLGLTAIWSGVAGSGKPADNATRNQTFFQDGDPVSSPGGVVDGAIWISSTKAWQRVSGAWQPYVGTASVNTNELAPGAAAVVLTSYVAGPVSDSTSG